MNHLDHFHFHHQAGALSKVADAAVAGLANAFLAYIAMWYPSIFCMLLSSSKLRTACLVVSSVNTRQ